MSWWLPLGLGRDNRQSNILKTRIQGRLVLLFLSDNPLFAAPAPKFPPHQYLEGPLHGLSSLKQQVATWFSVLALLRPCSQTSRYWVGLQGPVTSIFDFALWAHVKAAKEKPRSDRSQVGTNAAQQAEREGLRALRSILIMASSVAAGVVLYSSNDFKGSLNRDKRSPVIVSTPERT
eukprot:4849451-Amphidinium_carterae.3